MDLNARVDVNCGRKDERTETRTTISHLAKAGATKMNSTEHKTNETATKVAIKFRF